MPENPHIGEMLAVATKRIALPLHLIGHHTVVYEDHHIDTVVVESESAVVERWWFVWADGRLDGMGLLRTA